MISASKTSNRSRIQVIEGYHSSKNSPNASATRSFCSGMPMLTLTSESPAPRNDDQSRTMIPIRAKELTDRIRPVRRDVHKHEVRFGWIHTKKKSPSVSRVLSEHAQHSASVDPDHQAMPCPPQSRATDREWGLHIFYIHPASARNMTT